MKWFTFLALGSGLIALATCSVSPQASLLIERRQAFEARQETAKGYADFLSARYASLTNDPHKAAEFYAGAARSKPDDRDLLERAVFSALISGRMDTALLTARDAETETLSRTSLPRLVLGVEALKKGKPRQSELILLPETSSLFNDAISRNLIAWARVKRGQTQRAIEVLERPPSGDKVFDGLTESTLAFIQLHTGDDEGALETFESMWKARLRMASTTEYHARLLARTGDRDRAARLLRHFTNRIGQNAAIESLLRDVENGQSIALSRPTIAQGAALSIYTPAAALAAQTHNDLSGVYFAIALFLDPDLHIARTLWGNSLDQADRREDAIEILNEVPESSVFYATARGQIAWALRREGQNEAALKVAREALAFADDRNLKIQLGDLFRSLEQPAEAERTFTEIIASDAQSEDEDWRLLYARGTVREQLDRWSEAESDLLRANEIAPNQPALLNYLGYSWIDRGIRLEDGFEMIQRAAALRPDAGFIIDSLGWAHFRLGNFEQAVRYLERAVEIDPVDPTINHHLGDAYWRIGRRLEAGYQWTRAIRLDPESDEIVLLKGKLAEGLDRATARRTAKSDVH